VALPQVGYRLNWDSLLPEQITYMKIRGYQPMVHAPTAVAISLFLKEFFEEHTRN